MPASPSTWGWRVRADLRLPGQDVGHWVKGAPGWFAGGMFVRDEVQMQVSFEAARARLANLGNGDGLLTVSRDAYAEHGTAQVRVGPAGAAPVASRLVAVRYRNLVTRGDTAVLALRWEATGPGSALFPALDADITLAPAPDHSTLLSLDGAYRPPLGAIGAVVDRAVLNRVARATIRTFIRQIAAAITDPASAIAPERLVMGYSPTCLPADPQAT